VAGNRDTTVKAFCCCWQKVCRRRHKTLCEKETRRRHKRENADGNSGPSEIKTKTTPRSQEKTRKKNRRVILTRLFLTSSLS
jgi:hypothetical protein